MGMHYKLFHLKEYLNKSINLLKNKHQKSKVNKVAVYAMTVKDCASYLSKEGIGIWTSKKFD